MQKVLRIDFDAPPSEDSARVAKAQLLSAALPISWSHSRSILLVTGGAHRLGWILNALDNP